MTVLLPKAVLPLDMSILQHAASATPWTCLSIAACAAPGRVCSTADRYCPWACSFYSTSSACAMHRHGQDYFWSTEDYFVKLFGLFCFFAAQICSVSSFRMALPWTSEFPGNDQFLPQNNWVHFESILRNFFGTKFLWQPLYAVLGVARPQPQFPHSCVCERFMYIFPGLVHIFPAAEFIGRLIMGYIKRAQTHECGMWLHNFFSGNFCSNFWYWFFAVQL